MGRCEASEVGERAVGDDVVAEDEGDVEMEAVCMAGRVRMRDDGGKVVVAGGLRLVLRASTVAADDRRVRFTS